jgi:hypothetical protein
VVWWLFGLLLLVCLVRQCRCRSVGAIVLANYGIYSASLAAAVVTPTISHVLLQLWQHVSCHAAVDTGGSHSFLTVVSGRLLQPFAATTLCPCWTFGGDE